MTLFREAIDAPNAFPHGFYWTGIKGVPIAPAVEKLLSAARAKGVKAAYVAIETFHAYPVCCQIRPPDLFSGHGDARLSRFPA
jgi:hypothetical protein